MAEDLFSSFDDLFNKHMSAKSLKNGGNNLSELAKLLQGAESKMKSNSQGKLFQ